MKRFFFFLSSVFLTFSSSGQNAYQSEPKAGNDTIVPKKILIIPYEPKMYLSDADQQIAEYSDKNPRQIRAMFRIGLTNQLQAKLITVYPSQTMLANLTPQGMKDLDEVYHAINYSYDTVYTLLHPKTDSISSKNKKSASAKKKEEKELKKKLGNDVRYMNVVALDPTLIPRLSEKFDVDEVVFLSQLEIKTKYSDCLDASLNVYNRDMKVHYSVYDKSGKQLYGDIATSSFPSTSNDVGEIMANNFPTISNIILSSLKN